MTVIAKSKYSVDVREESVVIYHDHKEVLYWDIQEFIEDPYLVFNVVEAVKTAYEKPAEMDDIIKEMRRGSREKKYEIYLENELYTVVASDEMSAVAGALMQKHSVEYVDFNDVADAIDSGYADIYSEEEV